MPAAISSSGTPCGGSTRSVVTGIFASSSAAAELALPAFRACRFCLRIAIRGVPAKKANRPRVSHPCLGAGNLPQPAKSPQLLSSAAWEPKPKRNPCWRGSLPEVWAVVPRTLATRPYGTRPPRMGCQRRGDQALAASSASCRRLLGCTPTNRSTTSPDLKIISVGMLITP